MNAASKARIISAHHIDVRWQHGVSRCFFAPGPGTMSAPHFGHGCFAWLVRRCFGS